MPMSCFLEWSTLKFRGLALSQIHLIRDGKSPKFWLGPWLPPGKIIDSVRRRVEDIRKREEMDFEKRNFKLFLSLVFL